jgi:hypothetical protein
VRSTIRFVVAGIVALTVAWLSGCSSAPIAPSPIAAATVDVLDFVVGAPTLWPRMGDQYQNQIIEPSRVCWTKYTLGWMFECWRWDAEWIYHDVDHALDGRRWEYYTFTDGRWLPRRLPVDGVWELTLSSNRIRFVDADCQPEPERAAPYRLRAWFERAIDAGGDLGVRDLVVLEYQPDPEHAAAGTAERFYFARGAGWFLWSRADGPHITFNRVGGPARNHTPLCARDYGGPQ